MVTALVIWFILMAIFAAGGNKDAENKLNEGCGCLAVGAVVGLVLAIAIFMFLLNTFG